MENSMLKYILLSTTIMLSTVYAEPVSEPATKIKNGVLYYEGGLDIDTINTAKTLYKNAKIKPTVLEINSIGGDTVDGMYFGRFIHENTLDVRVNELCFSSCANFIFPAGKTKYIGKNAFIGWHGDGTSSDIYGEIVLGIPPEQSLRDALIKMYEENNMKYTEKQLQKDIKDNIAYGKQLQDMEDTFYADLNINPLLARYPHITEEGRKKLEKSPENSMGWTYTVSVMQQLGVKNIVLTDGNWIFDKNAYNKQKPEYYGATFILIDNIAQ